MAVNPMDTASSPEPRRAPASNPTLLKSINIGLDEILHSADFYVGLVGGGGFLWVALERPDRLGLLIPIAAGFVGVVIGAVLAGVAILSTFFDQAFLRKLRAIGKDPLRYLGPFIFTAGLGVLAALSLIAMGTVPTTAPKWLLGSVAFLAGFTSIYTLASVVPDLKLLVDFIGLQNEASKIPDDFQWPK